MTLLRRRQVPLDCLLAVLAHAQAQAVLLTDRVHVFDRAGARGGDLLVEGLRAQSGRQQSAGEQQGWDQGRLGIR